MKILFLTQIIPYPPDAGPKVKTLNVLRYLVSRGHQVTLVSFVRPEEMAAVPALRNLLGAVRLVPIRRRRVLEPYYWLRSLVSRRPYLVERDDRSEMRALVQKLAAEEQFDAIHADQVSMAQFALHARAFPGARGPALVFDAHNAVWVILDRGARDARGFVARLLRPLLAHEARQMKRYEGELVRAFDRTMAVSEIDCRYLMEAAGKGDDEGSIPPVAVIPIAVDTEMLRPVARKDGAATILTLGTLHYPPNAEGIRWFLNEVFPLIRARVPSAQVAILGKRPPKDFLALAAEEPGSYHVPGYVPDLTTWLEQSAVMVVPVRVGGGMRVRILEAFAHAIPVVTTTVGLEGIDAQPGRDVLVADDPAGFADAVLRVLAEPALQGSLSENSRRLAEERYDWKIVLRELDAVYTGLALHKVEG